MSGRRAVPARFVARGVDLLPCRRDRGGDAAVGIGQRGCRGDVAFELGDQRRRVLLALGKIAAELVDRIFEQHRLADGLLGRPDAHGRLAALARADRDLRRGELLVGERDALAGLLGIVGHGRERLGGVARGERAQMLVGGVDGCRGRRALILHARERLRCVLLELAQLVERSGLVVEARVRLFAEADDLGVPRADLLVGVGSRVVELLLERERPIEVLPRRLQRLSELDGRGIAELRFRESELLIARLDGVVGLHERGGRASLELLQVDLLDGRAGPGRDRRPSCGDAGR